MGPLISLENAYRILEFDICIAYEKLADVYFFFFSVRFFMVELGPFSDLGILANENLVSKIPKDPLELG